jgi:hypothetical protein
VALPIPLINLLNNFILFYFFLKKRRSNGWLKVSCQYC